MEGGQVNLKDIHWLMDMLQSIDVGLIVFDVDYKVLVWNSFMENHSGINPAVIKDKVVFDMCPTIPENWFRQKVESVLLLKSSTFTVWEQRPYLLKFKNFRPITGSAEFMYQNLTLIPLLSANNEVLHVGALIYDVTEVAVNKLKLEEANKALSSLSKTDHLTQLNNRGAWEGYLSAEFKRSKRTKSICSVVMFDIDHFKNVNDTHGHATGDIVLKSIGQVLKEQCRTEDFVARFGGEGIAKLAGGGGLS